MMDQSHQCYIPVRVDNRLTDWFSVYSGIRQGDKLAPTLFAIYVDDVTTCINQLNVGVPISETDSLSTRGIQYVMKSVS